MSISNYNTDGTKTWQNLNVNRVTANEIIVDSLEVEDLLINEIHLSEAGIEEIRAWNSRTSITTVATVAQNIINYDIAQDGDLSGFNPVTGIFTAPVAGVYYGECKLTKTSAGLTDWYFKCYDPTNLNQYFAVSILPAESADFPGGVVQGSFITNLEVGQQMQLEVTTLLGQTGLLASFRIYRLL